MASARTARIKSLMQARGLSKKDATRCVDLMAKGKMQEASALFLGIDNSKTKSRKEQR